MILKMLEQLDKGQEVLSECQKTSRKGSKCVQTVQIVSVMSMSVLIISKILIFSFMLQVTLYAPTEIKVGYSQNRVAGSGMANAGNTCYLNSTLQALFHTPALFNYFQYNCVSQHMSKCSSSMGATGFLQSCTICAMMNTLKDSLKSSVIRPNRIYEKLKIICKHMVMGRQEDAHEFLR